MLTILDLSQSPDSIHIDSLEAGHVCVANISAPERRKRLAFGATAFVITVAVLVILIATGASRWWRLALFPLFAGSTVGFFQWRDKT